MDLTIGIIKFIESGSDDVWEQVQYVDSRVCDLRWQSRGISEDAYRDES